MAWKIEWDEYAEKQFNKLDRQIGKRIINYLDKNVINNPRLFGKALTGDLAGLWRYRVEDFRIICHIKDEKLTVLVLSVGHRKEIYKIA